LLGIYRYILALIVAISHVWPGSMFTGGIYAVFCFYLVSGYLMSLVLNEVYVGWRNVGRYAANRFLRIYPPYLAVVFLSVASAVLFKDQLSHVFAPGLSMKDLIFVPANISNWVGNVTLLFPWNERLVVNQGWSLRVELVYYGLMIFLVRSRSVVILWFICSVAYVVYMHYSGELFFYRYSTVGGASIAFSMGALIYHFRGAIRVGYLHLIAATLLFAGNVLFARQLWSWPELLEGSTKNFDVFLVPTSYGLYVSLFLGAYLLVGIVSLEHSQGRLMNVGKKLGDIAYAIFLSHWLVALLVMGLGVPAGNSLAFIVAIMVTLHVMSFAIYVCVEAPVNRYFRDRIRVAVSR